jgi:chromosome partitioning protein
MISTQELSDILKVTPQRVGALTKTCNVGDEETQLRGRNRFYNREAVKKIFSYRGVNYDERKVLAVSNNKGGVGKTSIATSLAKRLTDLGYDVVLIDIDPQANSTSFFLNTEALQSKIKYVLHDVISGKSSLNESMVEISSGLRILPSSLLNSRLESELSNNQKNPVTFMNNILSEITDAHYIIFDMSPSFSKINFLCSLAANQMIVPTILTRFSVEGINMTLESLREWAKEYSSYRPEVRVLINQLDNRLVSQLQYVTSLQDIIKVLTDDGLDAQLFATVIHADNTINRIQSGLASYSSKSTFYSDISQLASEIVGFNSLSVTSEVNQ